MSGDDDGGGFLSLVSNRAPVKRTEPQGEADAASAYGVVKGQRTATTLRLIRKNRKPVTLPYAYLPIIWGDYLPELVLIEFPGLFTARLTGFPDLSPLEELLSEHRVTWIRACSQAEAAPLPLAVTRIDLLRYYPPREAAGDPRAAITDSDEES